VPLSSSTPQTSTATFHIASPYPATVPDWLRNTTHRPPEVILTPPQSTAAILRRTGSTCSRKSVRFVDDDDDVGRSAEVASNADPKKRVHFATERNQYLDPRISGSDIVSSAGSDAHDDVNSYDDLGDGASEMSYTNSDCSSGLYIVNRPNGYRANGAANNRPPIVAFRTFLPPNGSLV
jgi:hypothetical protein